MDKFNDAIEVVREVALKHSITPFIVGGYVRDKILNDINDDTDIDITTRYDNAIELAYTIAEEKPDIVTDPVTYEHFGTVMLMINGVKTEFTGDKQPNYIVRELNKLGVEPNSLNKDIYGRDFTINTMAINIITNDFLDITGKGMNDLTRDKILRTPISPQAALEFNPLIILRALRFVLQYGLRISGDFEKEIPKFIPVMREVTQREHRTAHIKHLTNVILAYGKPGIDLLEKYNLLDVLPETEDLENIKDKKRMGIDIIAQDQTGMQRHIYDRFKSRQIYKHRKRRETKQDRLKAMRLLKKLDHEINKRGSNQSYYGYFKNSAEMRSVVEAENVNSLLVGLRNKYNNFKGNIDQFINQHVKDVKMLLSMGVAIGTIITAIGAWDSSDYARSSELDEIKNTPVTISEEEVAEEPVAHEDEPKDVPEPAQPQSAEERNIHGFGDIVNYALDVIEGEDAVGIDAATIMAIGDVESNFRHNSVSSKGAQGYFQFTEKGAWQDVSKYPDFEGVTFDEFLLDANLQAKGAIYYLRDLRNAALTHAHMNWLKKNGIEPNYNTSRYDDIAAYSLKYGNSPAREKFYTDNSSGLNMFSYLGYNSGMGDMLALINKYGGDWQKVSDSLKRASEKNPAKWKEKYEYPYKVRHKKNKYLATMRSVR